jgi:predicted component of type VI protein secretion system
MLMPLLNKFVTPKLARDGFKRGSINSDVHLASILSNLQSILQSRRTVDLSQPIGLEDFSELSVSDALINELCQDIQRQISLHESRLNSVLVELTQSSPICWQLAVTAKLSKGNTEAETANPDVQFTLEIAKHDYQKSKQAINGVFL